MPQASGIVAPPDQGNTESCPERPYDALETILNVPRVFLPVVLRGCVAWAKENGATLVTAEHMKIINDKRAKEKNK